MEQYLETGKIVTTHGVKGFVKAEPWCDSPRILAQLPCIYIKTIQGFQKIRILHAAIQKNAVLLQLEGCTDLDSALHFKDTVIFADRNDIPKSKNDYFIADLIGLSVIDLETNQNYGIVLQIFNRGASDIYEIKMPNGKLAYLPAVAEFVKKIDLTNGIFVTPIPGFFDE